MSKPPPHPEPFWEIRVHRDKPSPSISGLCIGYESGMWREAQFVDHIMEWLPEFALRHSERESINSATSVALIKQAAKTVYESKKFKKRGEFGEVFLHAAIRHVFKSTPAISKIFYKTAHNDTVKGFDAVHVVGPPEDLELWLGEAKFYDDIARAIRDVIEDINNHTKTDYLRNEFALLKGKIDKAHPHAGAMDDLMKKNKSLDEVFKRVCIPVLLTYDSECVGTYSDCSNEYKKAFEEEIEKHFATFAKGSLPKSLRVHLFLLPLKSKRELVAALDKKIKAWQAI